MTIVLAILLLPLIVAPQLSIDLKNGTEGEQKTKQQLQRLLSSYDLGPYIYTQHIVIDEKSIPHSHPVLTLHTRHMNSDDELLSTFVHEQLHWFLAEHHQQTDDAEAQLRKLYPKVPVGYPDGARDEKSSYLHLVDCYLELQDDRELIGPARTAEVMKFWANDHYRWIYKTVVDDENRIGRVVESEHLTLKDAQTH